MRELSLFTGAGGGGGVIGTSLLGAHTVGYVEWNEYCQKVIRQRIEDGWLPEAPIFGDIRAFNSEGYAGSYSGMVDLITAGFPCQPFSAAGKQKGEEDHRNMWPATVDIIRLIGPKILFLENVPALLTDQYAKRIFADLARLGFDAKWGVLGAGETGSICTGKRLWILAIATNCPMLESLEFLENYFFDSEKSRRRQFTGAVRAAFSQDDYTQFKRNRNEVANGMERLKAIGNGQDPILAAAAFKTLIDL